MSATELDIFEAFFYRDLEKWFSAGIACCDHCHDDFLARWPLADHADEHHFQKTSIDVDSFYSGSYLQDHYTKADFDRYIVQLECPQCGNPLGANIWAYDLPFSIPPNFKHTIREISDLARLTPFLLLEHEFCREALSAIRDLGSRVEPVRWHASLFRGREQQPALSDDRKSHRLPRTEYDLTPCSTGMVTYHPRLRCDL